VHSLTLIFSAGIATVIGTLLFWRCIFLRDPDRVIPTGNVIVSPADGRIIRVEEFSLKHEDQTRIPKGWYGGITTTLRDIAEEGYIISVFMSVFSVHINRAPMAGMITSQIHRSGSLKTAQRFPRALLENERNEITITSPTMKLKVIQVAGLLARRIESMVRVGQTVRAGERIGLINLGSQCNVILPKQGVRLCVKEGDHVSAGSSILASLSVP
jgi:phosphatidylserine decarboxylase